MQAILNASNAVKSSVKFRSVLEIVLAFGNYLNSNRRGPAYGFKLQSLDTLLDTKSTDKRMCLLHYIVMTIRQKFPDLMDFDTELMYIERAAQVSLENLITDVHELEKGMENVRKEADVRNKGHQILVLKGKASGVLIFRKLFLISFFFFPSNFRFSRQFGGEIAEIETGGEKCARRIHKMCRIFW